MRTLDLVLTSNFLIPTQAARQQMAAIAYAARIRFLNLYLFTCCQGQPLHIIGQVATTMVWIASTECVQNSTSYVVPHFESVSGAHSGSASAVVVGVVVVVVKSQP